jgi:hypothetical protein
MLLPISLMQLCPSFSYVQSSSCEISVVFLQLSAIIFKERQSLGLVFVLRILEVSLFLHLKENYRSLPAGVIGCLRLGLCLGSEIESILSAALKVKRRVLVIMHRHCMFRGNKLYMWQQGWIDSRLRNL